MKNFILKECNVLAKDFDVVFSQDEKRGGSFIQDQFQEKAKDLISNWDLMDIKPKKEKYTWTNRIVGLGHIVTKLD